ncbi:MAG: CHAT domain-containing protein [Paracoccaceae bacterium]
MLAEPAADAAQIGALIKLGRLNQAIAAGAPRLTRSQGRAAHRHFAAARQHAASLGDQRLGSFAAGYFGGLYERAGRWQEAQRLTNEAIRLAQRSQSDDTLYVWHWQLGRILRARGDRPAAIAAHQSAIEALSLVRSDIVAGFGTGRDIFEETVRPLILDLADLLLQQAERARGDEQQRLLSAARETVELLKAAEYEDFFHDDCLAALQAQRRSLDVLPEGTAVLYPVVLADRVVLILGGPNGLSQFAAAAGTTELDRAVAMLRSGLSDAKSTRFRAQARQLYRWLIAPVEEALARTAVDTLVVVPTGALASIPFAALMDGDEFLIQKYAIAVAPGLSLIDSDPLADRRIEALVGGLTESVAGFPALPHVASELADVGSRFPSKVLRDDDLIRDDLIELLDRVPYGVVHLATHAKFEAEASESFLLTYDGRIDMDGLEQMVRQSRFRDQPIELLTLSACSTAEGDARAALGLAGIALKSGARSALASLWLVNDRSTADLVSRFYAGLVAPGATKAKALRQAQLALIASVDYDHPAYWSPFIIIGNWK